MLSTKQGTEIPTTGSLPEDYSKIWGSMEKWGEMGEYVSFCQTEWGNGDKPPKKRWIMVVFSAIGTRGTGGGVCWAMARRIMGGNGGNGGEMVENGEE